MELVLKRIAKKKGYTIGRLYIAPSNLIPAEAPTRSLSQKGEANAKEDSIGSSPLLGGQRGAFCDTLEPPCLEMKTTVSKEAVLRSPMKCEGLKPFAIPPGRYVVVISY